MAKIEVNKLLDMNSIVELNKFDAKLHDGINTNGAISGEALKVMAGEVFEYFPDDVTWQDIGFTISNVGGYANFVTSIKRATYGGYEKQGNKSKTKGIIGVIGNQTSIPIFGYDAISTFTEVDIKQAQLEKRNIRTELYQAHGEAYFAKIDEMVYDSIGTLGFEEVPSGGDWDTKTDDEISNELRNFIIGQISDVNNIQRGDTLILPKSKYLRIVFSDYKSFSERSILEKVRDSLRSIGITFKAVGTNKLTKDAVFLNTSRANALLRIPLPLRFSREHQQGFQYSFMGMFRVGGLDISSPKIGRILKDIGV